jgi:hypothetical protein
LFAKNREKQANVINKAGKDWKRNQMKTKHEKKFGETNFRCKKSVHRNGPGLPDGKLADQKSYFGTFLRSLELKILVYFMSIWNML